MMPEGSFSHFIFMFETLLNHFQDGGAISLWGPFFILLVCGFGMPVPEDIILITAGALSASEGRQWEVVAALMYVAVIGGDTLVYCTGRFLGSRVMRTRWFRRILTVRKQEKVAALFARYGSIVFFVGRFLPGLRTPIFFTAGSIRANFWKFFILDGLAALISAPVFVFIGHWLWMTFGGDNWDPMIEELKKVQGITVWVTATVAVIGVALIWWRWRKFKRNRTEAETAAGDDGEE